MLKQSFFYHRSSGALYTGGLGDIVYIYILVWSGDRFDCSKLLNRVEPITQTRPEEKRKIEKGEKGEIREKGEKRIKRRRR